MILSRGPAARRAFDRVVARTVSHQVKSFARQTRESDEIFVGAQSVHEFDWEKYMGRLKGCLPTLLSAATAAMPNNSKQA